MVKISKELSLGVLLVLVVIMVLKPNLLGFLYNNVLGKLVFVAAVVFLSLKHTAAGLLAVVFVAIVASMSGYHGFEGMAVPDDKEGNENMDEETDEKKKKAKVAVKEGMEPKKCEGDNCATEGAEGQANSVNDIKKLLKSN
jgi:membrane protein implicated in regulation of membrane protease activity